jgi:hypothetical protein
MARALVASVVVFAAGEEAGFVFGAAVAFGDADALALALGAGAGDFFVAAEEAMGAEHARPATQAVIKLSLFFMAVLFPFFGFGICFEFRNSSFGISSYSSGLPCSSGSQGNVSGPFSVQTA